MKSSIERFYVVLRQVWRGIREWSGDADYERYQKSAAARQGGSVRSRDEFYIEQLDRKYSRPNRCC